MHRLRYILIFLLLTACSHDKKKSDLSGTQNSNSFGVLTFNMWQGGEAGGQPPDSSIKVIRNSGAKIVGLQEIYGYAPDGSSHNNAAKIAGIMGWNLLDQGGYGIMSEYPFSKITPSKKGVKIEISRNRYIWFFNCHLNYIPYQPYQLANIKYGDFPFISDEKEAVAYADSARGTEVREYIIEILNIMTEGWPVLLTGDFNEPSFQDWTRKAVNNNLCRLKVEWPSTKAFHGIGLVDAFRMIYPDEVKNPGKTWSSLDSPGEIHDRIDFVFYKGDQLIVSEAKTLGFPDGISGMGIEGYTSDHRAVYVNFQWRK